MTTVVGTMYVEAMDIDFAELEKNFEFYVAIAELERDVVIVREGCPSIKMVAIDNPPVETPEGELHSDCPLCQNSLLSH